jgi:hypothetical protein
MKEPQEEDTAARIKRWEGEQRHYREKVLSSKFKREDKEWALEFIADKLKQLSPAKG